MKCVNCGVAFNDNLLKCPYCGAENEVEAFAEHIEKINNFKDRERAYRKLPEILRKNAGKIIAFVAVAAILLTIIFSVIGYFVSHNKSNSDYEKTKRYQKELEELYLAENYDEISNYMQNNSIGYSTFLEKYDHVNIMNRYYHRLDMCKSHIQEILKTENSLEQIRLDFKYAFELLEICYQYENDRYDYGEDAAILYYRDKTVAILKEIYLLTEDEINDGLSLYMQKGSLEIYFSYSYERIKGQ